MRSRKLVAMFACFIVLVTAPLAYAQTLPSSQALGLKPGGVQSFARDVSASGSVVIGTYWVADPPGVRQLAFRWEAGTFQDFETLNPNARGAQGRAVSDVGSEIVGKSRGIWTGSVVIGTYGAADPPGVPQLVLRWEAGTFQDLGALNPNAREAEALAVSDDGSKVVGWSRDTGGFQRPFLWTATGGMQELPDIPCCEAKATGISPDGSVIVGYYLPAADGYHGFRWSAGVMTDLGLLPGRPDGKAPAVCGLGAVVVDTTTFPGKAFRWRSSSGMEDLGFGRAEGCSNDNGVVVGTELSKDMLAAPSDPKGLRALDALGGIWVGTAVDGAWEGEQLPSADPLHGGQTVRPGNPLVADER